MRRCSEFSDNLRIAVRRNRFVSHHVCSPCQSPTVVRPPLPSPGVVEVGVGSTRIINNVCCETSGKNRAVCENDWLCDSAERSSVRRIKGEWRHTFLVRELANRIIQKLVKALL